MSTDSSIPSSLGIQIEEPLPPPAARHKSLLYLVGAVAGGNMAATAVRTLAVIIQGRFVGPSVLGLFTGIGLVQGYAPLAQLGVLNAMNRELPYYVGKGEWQRVRELAATAQAWAMALAVLIGTGLLCVAAWYLAHGEGLMAAGWATNAVLVFTLFYSTTYLQMTYRTSHDFTRLALVNVMVAVLALVLVALVALMSFYGLCLRLLISELIGMALLHYFRPVRVGPQWNWQHFKHLLIVGLPIFVAAQLYVLWGVLDRQLVLYYTGDKGLGLYAQAVTIMTSVEMLPLALSQVIYPRMAERYGRAGRLAEIVQLAWKPTLLATLGMIPVIAVAWCLVGPAMRWALPKYVEAVPAIQWSLLVPLVTALCCVNCVFLVARRLGLYIVAILCGMAAYGVALFWLIRGEVSLIAFPQAMLVGRTVFALTSYGFIALLCLTSRPQRGSNRGGCASS